MLGREIKLPMEVMYKCASDHNENSSYGEYIAKLRDDLYSAHIIVRRKLREAAKVQKDRYDTKTSLNVYSPGSLVLMLLSGVPPDAECHKLLPKYHGPFLVLQRINDILYRIQVDSSGSQKIVHHDKMKPYHGEELSWMRCALKKFQKTL
jgi:hypothetical protein